MRANTGNTFLKTLLTTTSVMALSVGAANATAVLSDYTSMPFTFGDKQVVFNPDNCDPCDQLGLTALAPDMDGNIGFRISFPVPPMPVDHTPQVGLAYGAVLETANGGQSASGQTNHSSGVEFSVTAAPMFKIIGAVLGADASVTASYDYNANGENFGGGGTGSTSASGNIDIGLAGTTNSLMLNLNYMTAVGSDTLQQGTPADNDSDTGMKMMMGMLTPDTTHSFSLQWDVSSDGACDLQVFGPSDPECSAQATSAINYIDIRFKQMEMAVPEPGTLALFGLGLAGLGAVQRRRRRR